jgi:hypothetical protein
MFSVFPKSVCGKSYLRSKSVPPFSFHQLTIERYRFATSFNAKCTLLRDTWVLLFKKIKKCMRF